MVNRKTRFFRFFILFAFFDLPIFSVDAEVVGYGYRLRSVTAYSPHKSLTAILQLINHSSVYGPDLPLLSLTARFILHRPI